MAKATGTTGAVTIAGTIYKVSQFEVTGSTDWQDVTDTGSLGFNETIPGLRSSSGNFEIFVDIASPPTIIDRETLADIVLTNTIGMTSYTAYSCAKIGVDSVEISNDVQGTLTFSVDFHSILTYQFGVLPS